jgi:hypothetical protein
MVSPSRFLYVHNCKLILYYIKLAMECHGHKFCGCSGSVASCGIACEDLERLLSGNTGII